MIKTDNRLDERQGKAMKKSNLRIKLAVLFGRSIYLFMFFLLLFLGVSHIFYANVQQKDLSQLSKKGFMIVRVPKDVGSASTVTIYERTVDSNGEEYLTPIKRFWVKPGEEKEVPETYTAVCAYNALSTAQILQDDKVIAEVTGPQSEKLLWKLKQEQGVVASSKYEPRTYVEVYKEKDKESKVYFQRVTKNEKGEPVGLGNGVLVREGQKAGAAGACDEVFVASSLKFPDALAAQVREAMAREEIAGPPPESTDNPPLPSPPPPGDEGKPCSSPPC